MTRLIAILTLALVPLLALAAAPPPPATAQQTVTINAKGLDVRSVLHDVFTQTNHNYVLEPNVRFVIYLSVKDIDFEEALQIVCKLASLDYQLQNGIYYVGPKHAPAPPQKPDVKPTPPPPKAQPIGTLPRGVMSKLVTTRLPKAEFTTVVAEITRQTGVLIELEPSIAKWKLDAFFNASSLRYVLDRISQAGRLTYRFTDHLSIEIMKPEPKSDQNRVTVFRD